MVKRRGNSRSMLYFVILVLAIQAFTCYTSQFILNDYYSQIAASGTQDGGVCFPTRGDTVRPLLSTETVTGPTAIISQFDPDIVALNEPFCLAATYRANLSNTAPLLQYYIPSSGSNAVGSLVIDSGGVTFSLRSQFVTFSGGQFADDAFKQIQICVTDVGATLYLECRRTGISRPFSLSNASVDVSNGLVTFYRGVNMQATFRGVGQQLYVIGLPDPAVLDYTLQDVVNIQCDAIPSSCSLPVQPLQALVDALGTAATISISSAMRNTEVEMATSVCSCDLEPRSTVLHVLSSASHTSRGLTTQPQPCDMRDLNSNSSTLIIALSSTIVLLVFIILLLTIAVFVVAWKKKHGRRCEPCRSTH